jgi:hypothetical protein
MSAFCPDIRVEKDYDGYYENLVRSWIKRKATPWKCGTIVISASPYIPEEEVICEYDEDNPKELHLHFHSHLRKDYWDSKEVYAYAQEIIDEWF